MKPSKYFYDMSEGKLWIPTSQIVKNMDSIFIDKKILKSEIERLFKDTPIVIHKETFRKKILELLK